ncbi:probable WRKY transcription factor 70 [Solanum lycopersicum]|uniref:WRKY domain-containing protein n=1 Tax=Solanum lycopersicum TaxID=4081 RepID=A0A3Q7HL61_SOLLC|nr:probable WRKY transcription factor 33 [Solanum lycopersicum]
MDVSRKLRFFEQVGVNTESEVEGPQDDGYRWRKYGQKDILGSTFSRGCYKCTFRRYYKCTFRRIENCQATKHMQRFDVGPAVFEITYGGYHTFSRCQINGLGIAHNLDHSEKYLSDIGLFRDLHHSDSDRTDSFSTNSSTTSSSIGGEFARSSGARPDFSIFTKRHPQTKANTPQKDDKDE